MLVFKVMGVMLMLTNLVTEVTYLVKHQFASITLFLLYLALVVSKLVVPVLIALFKVRSYIKPPKSLIKQNSDFKLIARDHKLRGILLYVAAIPLL